MNSCLVLLKLINERSRCGRRLGFLIHYPDTYGLRLSMPRSKAINQSSWMALTGDYSTSYCSGLAITPRAANSRLGPHDIGIMCQFFGAVFTGTVSVLPLWTR